MDVTYCPHPGFASEVLAARRCAGCGGALIITAREPAFRGTLPVEHVHARCTSCHATTTIILDVTAYRCKC